MNTKFYLLIALAGFLQTSAQTGIPVPQMSQCDNLVKNFLSTYNIPGATFAMSKNGKIVYMRGFGFADQAKTIPVQPHNLFRIASVSKPITGIAIMKMMQDGLLTMSSKVFGTGGLLENHPVISTANITDSRIYNITVQQLLEHSAGWNRDVNCNPNPTTPYPYFFAGCDPINTPLRVTQQLGLPNPVTEEAYCKYVLQMGLNFAPGTDYNYSNMGYLFLGEIIEQLSGMSYEDYIKTKILAPLGIYDMHIGKNMLNEKQEREVEYTGSGHTNLSIYGDGTNKPWEYGGMNVNAMDAHGGWIATARDLVTLVNAVDGFTTKPDILTTATLNVMVAPSANAANYAKGWQVNASNNWWHTGAIPGTASILTRTSGGYTWTVILNKRNETNRNFWSALDALPFNCISSTATWPTFDLMLFPTQNAAGISFSNVTGNSVTVSWTNGNGGNRLLVVQPETPVNAFPVDGTDYNANADYASATSLGSASKVVYNGTGNSVTVTGLTAGQTYHFRVIEYNKTTATGNNALYQLGNNVQSSVATLSTLPVKLTSFTANKTANRVKAEWTTAQEINTSYYLVERSLNGILFSDIGKVLAAGNTSISTFYSFTDDLSEMLPETQEIYYRLKIVDKDGTTTYSPVALVSLMQNSRFTISPNPAKNVLNISGSNIKKVQVLDLSGKLLLTKEFVAGPIFPINISHLSAGVYFVRMTDKQGSSQTKRLVVVQ